MAKGGVGKFRGRPKPNKGNGLSQQVILAKRKQRGEAEQKREKQEVVKTKPAVKNDNDADIQRLLRTIKATGLPIDEEDDASTQDMSSDDDEDMIDGDEQDSAAEDSAAEVSAAEESENEEDSAKKDEDIDGVFEDVSDVEDLVEEENVETDASTLSASQIDSMLTSEETGMKECVNLFKSLCRSVLSGPEATNKFKTSSLVTKKGKAENERMLAMQKRFANLKASAPYVIGDDVESLGPLLYQTLVKIEGILEANTQAPDHKVLRPLFTDAILFLDNRGCRDPSARVMLTGLGRKTMASLFANGLTERFARRFFQICIRSDLSAEEGAISLLQTLRNFFEVLGSKARSGKKSKELTADLEACLQRFLSTWALATIKRAGAKTLDQHRRLGTTLVAIINGLQTTGHAKLVYDMGFKNLRTLVFLTANYMSKCTAKQGKSNKQKGLQKRVADMKQELYSFSPLLQMHVWISATILQDQSMNTSKFDLTKLGEGWGTLLITLNNLVFSRDAYFPYIVKIFRLLTSLMNATKAFLPIGFTLLRFGMRLIQDHKVKSVSTKLVKPVTLMNVLKLEPQELTNLRTQQDLFSEFVFTLTEYLALLARHPAFPETSIIVITHVKKMAKMTQDASKSVALKKIAAACEATAQTIVQKRENMSVTDLPESLFVFDQAEFTKFEIAQLQ